MKNFKLLAGLAALFSLLCSCDQFLLTPYPTHGRGRARYYYLQEMQRDTGSVPGVVVSEKSVYACAVCFPEGYDWRQDSLYGTVDATIVVFKDTSVYFSIPAGGTQEVSPDPDLHHFLNGDLYTEYAGADYTIVKKNGEKLFSYKGREVLRGLYVDGNDVYTLGQSRNGDGFSFRLNGELLWSRSGCLIFGDMMTDSYDPWGALYLDNGELCFSYCESDAKTCYLYCGGREEKLMFPCVFGRVFDVRRCEGKICALGTRGLYSPVFVEGNRFKELKYGDPKYHEDFRIIPGSDGEPRFCVSVNNGFQDSWSTMLWSITGQWITLQGRMDHILDKTDFDKYVFSDYISPLGVCAPWIINPYMHENYTYISYRCSMLSEDKIYLALTRFGGETPFIWMNDEKTEYDFNGFFTAVDVR